MKILETLLKTITYPTIGNLSSRVKSDFRKKHKWFSESCQEVSSYVNFFLYTSLAGYTAVYFSDYEYANENVGYSLLAAGIYCIAEGLYRVESSHTKEEGKKNKEFIERMALESSKLGDHTSRFEKPVKLWDKEEDFLPGTIIGKIVSLPYDIYAGLK